MRDPSGQALSASPTEPVPVSALSGNDPSRGTSFSFRQSVMDAIEHPEGQLPRMKTDDALEHELHWQARAAIKALCSSRDKGRDYRIAKKCAMDVIGILDAAHAFNRARVEQDLIRAIVRAIGEGREA